MLGQFKDIWDDLSAISCIITDIIKQTVLLYHFNLFYPWSTNAI